MEGKRILQGVIVIAFLITLVLVAATFTELYVGREIPFQIVAAFISVAMMGVVTWVLLRGQRIVEEEKDKNIRIFKERLKIYAGFNQALWECMNEEMLIKLRNKCMYKLVLMLPYKEMEELTKLFELLSENVSNERCNAIKSDITAVLKNDILGKNNLDKQVSEEKSDNKDEKSGVEQGENEKHELRNVLPTTEIGNIIFNLERAFQVEHIRDIQEDEKIRKEDKINEKEASLVAFDLKNKRLRDIWEDYSKGGKQCWHFAAWDNDIQNRALREQNKNVLSLMEYDEDWRTERLKQVKEGDILFLFNRGGAGYVGMYKAAGNFIIHNPAEGKVTVLKNGCKEEREPDEKEIEQYDIYEAYNKDDATYVSNVIVEKIKELDGDTYNPINVIRQTIARLSKSNVEALLKYFDGKETGKDN